MINNQHTYAVILAGGGGTRLWPKSRKETPKQFLKLTGKKTMMQVSAERITKLVPWERIIVVTNQLYRQDIIEQLPEVVEENIIAEPQKKDTAIAMLIGALYAKSLDPKAVILNFASDHIVTDQLEFQRVVTAASQVAAKNDYLVTVGITPTEAHTGFGYIKVGQELKRLNHSLSLFKVDNFTEKPNKATARAYLSTNKYFWNANMYVWSAVSIEQAFAQHMPEIHQLTAGLNQLAPAQFKQKLKEIYQQVEKISIDYAISEKAENLVLIPGDFGWNDVGSWKVVYELGKKDLNGNVVVSDQEQVHTMTVQSQRNLIHADQRLVALLGVKDLIVIDTDEIVLVASKNKSQEVKKVVNRLKEADKQEYL